VDAPSVGLRDPARVPAPREMGAHGGTPLQIGHHASCQLVSFSMKPAFEIVAEPKGQTYIDLLEFAASACSSFSLVWRDQFKFEQTAYEIKRALQPFLISNERTDEWPGTTLIGHKALVRRYRVTEESVQQLRAAEGLYAWLHPNLPEDLAFYSSEDMAWLASISHEGQAWLLDHSLRAAEIYAWVPHIKIREHKGW
jgi:hypothetical protein